MVSEGHSPKPSQPWYRSKPPAQIVQSALSQIAKKRNSGCSSCVDAYVDLARKNGATEIEIQGALGLTELANREDGRKDDQGPS